MQTNNKVAQLKVSLQTRLTRLRVTESLGRDAIGAEPLGAALHEAGGDLQVAMLFQAFHEKGEHP